MHVYDLYYPHLFLIEQLIGKNIFAKLPNSCYLVISPLIISFTLAPHHSPAWGESHAAYATATSEYIHVPLMTPPRRTMTSDSTRILLVPETCLTSSFAFWVASQRHGCQALPKVLPISLTHTSTVLLPTTIGTRVPLKSNILSSAMALITGYGSVTDKFVQLFREPVRQLFVCPSQVLHCHKGFEP